MVISDRGLWEYYGVGGEGLYEDSVAYQLKMPRLKYLPLFQLSAPLLIKLSAFAPIL